MKAKCADPEEANDGELGDMNILVRPRLSEQLCIH